MPFETVTTPVEAAVEDKLFPCAAFAIGKRDTVLFEGCHGAVDGKPITRGTRFDMASVTKTVVPTVLALRFLERGLFSLHEPISGFLENVPADKADITLKHLLTHTSGLQAHILLQSQTPHPHEACRVILDSALSTPIGTATAYSCLGFILLGAILEKVGGQPLDALAREWVLHPLGMHDSGYNPTGGGIAPTEIDKESGKHLQGVVHDENARFLGGVSANAGLFSTLADMEKYAAFLSNGGKPLLRPPTLDAATQNHTPGMDEARGLGFSLYDGRPHAVGDLFPVGSYGHTGFTGTSFFVDSKTGLYAILLTNRVYYGRENNITHFRRRFHNAVQAAINL